MLKDAMMLTVGCRHWKALKNVLVETSIKDTPDLDDVAMEAFQRYKSTQTDEDIELISYAYYGDIATITLASN